MSGIERSPLINLNRVRGSMYLLTLDKQDPATLLKITQDIKTNIASEASDPDKVRETFLKTITVLNENSEKDFETVATLLDIGRVIAPYMPPTWTTLVSTYQDLRPLVDDVQTSDAEEKQLEEKFDVVQKEIIKNIIHYDPSEQLDEQVKHSFLTSARTLPANPTRSDVLTLLYAGQLIAPYLPTDQDTLQSIEQVVNQHVVAMENRLGFDRAIVYSEALEVLLDCIQDHETKPKIVFSVQPKPVTPEPITDTQTKKDTPRRIPTPRRPVSTTRRPATRPSRVITETTAYKIQDAVEALRLNKQGISNEEIAVMLDVKEHIVRNAVALLIAAGKIESQRGKPKPETAGQLAQVKALRTAEEYFSDAEIATALGIGIERVHTLVNQLLDTKEIEPRPHPGKTGPTPETIALMKQIKLLRDGPEQLSQPEIARRLGKGKNYVKKLIRLMLASGELSHLKSNNQPATETIVFEAENTDDFAAVQTPTHTQTQENASSVPLYISILDDVERLRKIVPTPTIAQIAGRLGVGERTVRRTVSALLEAGKIGNKAQIPPEILDAVEILRTTESDLTNAQIAERLNIGEDTVKNAAMALIAAKRIESKAVQIIPPEMINTIATLRTTEPHLSRAQIAGRLGIEENTVKVVISNLIAVGKIESKIQLITPEMVDAVESLRTTKPHLTYSQIAERLGIRKKTVEHAVRILIDAGRIEPKKKDPRRG